MFKNLVRRGGELNWEYPSADDAEEEDGVDKIEELGDEETRSEVQDPRATALVRRKESADRDGGIEPW